MEKEVGFGLWYLENWRKGDWNLGYLIAIYSLMQNHIVDSTIQKIAFDSFHSMLRRPARQLYGGIFQDLKLENIH